jgi:DNA-binding transcriptional MocR family regulator
MRQTDLIRLGFSLFAKTADIEQLLGYPTRTDTQGVRNAFRNWIQDVPLGRFELEDMVITQGGQHAGISILQTLQRAEWSKVLVDSYSYSGFREAALLSHSDIFSVAMDELDAITEEFERVAIETDAKVYFTSTEVNNPTTVFTSSERRHKIAKIAESLGISIIEDDCFRLGPYKGETYRSLLPHSAWYVTSVSKPLSPALRIGVAIAPKGQARNLEDSVNYSTLGVAQSIQFVTTFLLTHQKCAEVQEAVRTEISKYVIQTVNILGQFDLRWREDIPPFWLYLPRGWRAADFCRAALERGIAILPAENFILRSGNAPDAVRISINAEHGKSRFIEGLEILVDLLRNPVRRTIA